MRSLFLYIKRGENMPTIDNLDIEISASAKSADTALTNLVNKLGKVQTAISNLNVSNFSGFAVGVKNVSNAMQGLSNVKMPDYTRLAKGITRLSQIDTATIRSAGGAIGELAKSLRVLDNVQMSDNAQQLTELASAVKQLGYKSATQAVENIPKLAVAMEQLMQTLSRAPQVSRNLIDMTNALAALARTGSTGGRAANALGTNLLSYNKVSKRSIKGTRGLASALGKMYATYWLVIRAAGKLKEAIDISSDLTEVQNVVDVTFGKYSNLIEEMSKNSITDFGMSELTVKQVASRFQAMGSAIGISQQQVAKSSEFLAQKGVNAYGELGDSMANMSINLTKLAADMASFYNVEQSAVAEDLASVFTGETRPLRTYGLDLTQATLSEWAMKQGLDANIQSMSQAEKTMLRYQYVLANTTAAQGDFVRTADKLCVA